MDWENIGDKFSAFGESFGHGLRKVLGSRNERMVRRLQPNVARINELEGWAQGLSADDFRAKTDEFRRAVQEGGTELDEILPEAFAMVREASVRTLGMRHFDVQLVGGMILHGGSIAEMATGEGKTLVATLPLYLNALAGKPVYLITVNDYLARRDAQWMGPIYEYLGVSCGSIQSNMHPGERLPIYACDIVYGTNNEFGFDYLRDNMKQRVEDQVQRYLSYAIVDEVDSVLIDEARTPLIISGPAEQMADKYKKADSVARKLDRDEHYEVKEKERSVSLLEEGIEQAEKMLGVDSFYTAGNEDWPHYLENALRAKELYHLDQEYVVEEGEVVIVDEFTGRKMPGRRWSDGLHQAVETKEGLRIREENQTMATITFQNYFRMYDKLAGMTGTAVTEAGEFLKIYELDVLSVPTNRPVIRADQPDVVYRTEPEKWKAIVEEIEEVHGNGQPILVGTTSVENSEKISKLLNNRGIPHEILNAKNHAREAEIVARAGERGAVTVSTNMAGRGTDIKLGGNFEHRLRWALEKAGLVEGDPEHLEEIDRVRERVREECARDEAEVHALGGLYVLGTERHEARRIDNQLRGRSGRQGNAGESRFFLSLQDPLMRRFYRDGVVNLMERLGMKEGVPIESGMVTRAIKRAQKKVEDYNFEIRKNLLEYDEVMDHQRKTIYQVRQDVLDGRELREKIEEMLVASVSRAASVYEGDPEGFRGWFHTRFGFELDEAMAQGATRERDMELEPVHEVLRKAYDDREKELGDELCRQVERYLLMRAIDLKWKDHLKAVDALRAGIGLRGYAQRDPKNEYKREGFELFQKLIEAVEEDVSSKILRIQVQAPAGAGAMPSGALPTGTGAYAGARALTPEALRRIQAERAARERRAQSTRRPPAALAFDQERRRRAVLDMMRQQSPAPDAEPTPAATQPPPEDAAPARSSAAPASDPRFKGVGRNEPCPCGSGKKFKKCHG